MSDLEALVDGWLSLPEVAERLGLDIVRTRHLLRERKLVAVRRGGNGVLCVPAAFVAGDGTVLKGLPGTLTVLADNGYAADEAIRWLFTPDDSLPGTPVQALAGDRGTEVKRRAQALGF
ncbi:MAG TPA: Rv2175c family DNA-binding protein [Mycobacteriales bacterium]|nr:Rv2175c family DNA-binding protein [Mycobacteriales bacterium]